MTIQEQMEKLKKKQEAIQASLQRGGLSFMGIQEAVQAHKELDLSLKELRERQFMEMAKCISAEEYEPVDPSSAAVHLRAFAVHIARQWFPTYTDAEIAVKVDALEDISERGVLNGSL